MYFGYSDPSRGLFYEGAILVSDGGMFTLPLFERQFENLEAFLRGTGLIPGEIKMVPTTVRVPYARRQYDNDREPKELSGLITMSRGLKHNLPGSALGGIVDIRYNKAYVDALDDNFRGTIVVPVFEMYRESRSYDEPLEKMMDLYAVQAQREMQHDIERENPFAQWANMNL